jgi:hypothetical protein
MILKLNKGVEMLQGRDELVLVEIGRGYARDAEYVEPKAKGRAKGGRVTVGTIGMSQGEQRRRRY